LYFVGSSQTGLPIACRRDAITFELQDTFPGNQNIAVVILQKNRLHFGHRRGVVSFVTSQHLVCAIWPLFDLT